MSAGGYWQVGKSLAETNRRMLESQLGTDVQFKVGEECSTGDVKMFKAHKYMLVSRSPVFETMFYGSVAEKGEVILIPDIYPSAFQMLLEYLYTEQCHLEDIETAVHTVYAAKKYMMSRLVNHAVRFIVEHITVDNVCSVLEYCKGLDEDKVVKHCFEYIGENAAVVIHKDTFFSLSARSLRTVLTCDSLFVLEEDLLKALIEWGERNSAKDINRMDNGDHVMLDDCKLKVKVEKDRFEVIRDFLPFIRFPLIPYDKLADLNSKHGILSGKQIQHVFNYQAGKVYPQDCTYDTKLRGSYDAVRFTINDDYAVSNLVCKREIVKRKFYVELRPVKPRIILHSVSIMNGPYLVQVLIFDPTGHLVSHTKKDFSKWPEQECCKETVLVLQEPVVCEASDDPYKIEIYLSNSSAMYWYDNIIVGKFTGNQDVKLKFFNPEIISKLHYFVQ